MDSKYEVFIGGRYSSITSQNTKDLMLFITKICNKMTLEINISQCELSREEYEHILINDIEEYYKEEDKSRRIRYKSDNKYRDQLMKQYSNEVEINEYFDRLRNYDQIEINNIKEERKKWTVKSSTNVNEIRNATDNKKKELDKLFYSVWIGSKFSPTSNAIMGSIYKMYWFNINNDLINYFVNKNSLLNRIKVGDKLCLENPTFYYNDRIITIVTTHEHSGILYLTQEEFYDFEKLGIPYLL